MIFIVPHTASANTAAQWEYVVPVKIDCECGRRLTMYDFVFTGLVDAGHSKSLIVHGCRGMGPDPVVVYGDKVVVRSSR